MQKESKKNELNSLRDDFKKFISEKSQKSAVPPVGEKPEADRKRFADAGPTPEPKPKNEKPTIVDEVNQLLNARPVVAAAESSKKLIVPELSKKPAVVDNTSKSQDATPIIAQANQAAAPRPVVAAAEKPPVAVDNTPKSKPKSKSQDAEPITAQANQAAAPAKAASINYQIFAKTFEYLGINEDRSDKIIEKLITAYTGLEEAEGNLNSDPGTIPIKTEELLNDIKNKQEALNELIKKLSSAFDEGSNRRPKKEIKSSNHILGVMEYALHWIDDIVTITGDSSLYLQAQKFKVEAKLQMNSDKVDKGFTDHLHRFGNLLLLGCIKFLKMITDTTVKLKALAWNTNDYRQKIKENPRSFFQSIRQKTDVNDSEKGKKKGKGMTPRSSSSLD